MAGEIGLVTNSSGSTQGVGGSDNRIDVSARMNERIYYISRDRGLAFSWSNATYDPDAADTILCVKNTSPTRNLYIYEIYVSSDTETEVQIQFPTATFVDAGTSVTGVNMNRTSSNAAEATATADETANAQGNIVWRGEVQATGQPEKLEVHGTYILGQNDAICVDFVAATTAAWVVIEGWYE